MYTFSATAVAAAAVASEAALASATSSLGDEGAELG